MFKFKDYILTPLDLYRGIFYLFKKASRKDWFILAGLVIVFLFARNYLQWQFDSSLFFVFLLAIFIWNLDSRISIALALICLIIVPFLLALDEKLIVSELKDWAEQFAVWAYYFLVIGVFKQVFDFRKESKVENIILADLKQSSFSSQKTSQLKTTNQSAKFNNTISIDELLKKLEEKEKVLKKEKKSIVMDIIPQKRKLNFYDINSGSDGN
jgi:hypothetical protein